MLFPAGAHLMTGVTRLSSNTVVVENTNVSWHGAETGGTATVAANGFVVHVQNGAVFRATRVRFIGIRFQVDTGGQLVLDRCEVTRSSRTPISLIGGQVVLRHSVFTANTGAPSGVISLHGAGATVFNCESWLDPACT